MRTHEAAPEGTRDAYGVPELARRLGVHEDTVRRRIDTGRLIAVRDGRRILVRAPDLAIYLAALPRVTARVVRDV